LHSAYPPASIAQTLIKVRFSQRPYWDHFHVGFRMCPMTPKLSRLQAPVESRGLTFM
jgi:hypothetical protein